MLKRAELNIEPRMRAFESAVTASLIFGAPSPAKDTVTTVQSGFLPTASGFIADLITTCHGLLRRSSGRLQSC